MSSPNIHSEKGIKEVFTFDLDDEELYLKKRPNFEVIKEVEEERVPSFQTYKKKIE